MTWSTTPVLRHPFSAVGLIALAAAATVQWGCAESKRPVTQRIQNPQDEWVYSIDTGVGGRPDTTRPLSDPLRSVYYGLPQGRPLDPMPAVLFNNGYVVGYDVPAKTPLWACYRLFASSANPTPAAKNAAFATDARTRGTAEAEAEADSKSKSGRVDDYAGKGGYSRRLLAPTGLIGADYGEDAAHETLLSSNVLPVAAGRNDVWDQITGLEWAYAQAYDELWVICGPLFSGDVKALPSGSAVPEGFWKIHITVRKGRSRIQSFIVPQPSGNAQQQKADLADYLVSVGEIEEKTGLTFFPAIHDIDGDTAELRHIKVQDGIWPTERDTAAR
ncbi:MAG: DNA/RNA non-specific endonuclease [Planctomycetes bacterium]|nr:DNA/RNA non-specific endonuclease [Planctomycetota bacterium]